ncbi:MAG: hypothetical protein EOM52_00310 [Clostridia bacterium]|nr:hypothetical protein [Clostridia bacterium]
MRKSKPTSLETHKFEEERARQVLMYCFPNKYSAAQLSESPDIIVPTLSIGVEVTESILQSVQQNMSRASDITGKQIDELSEVNRTNISTGRVVAQVAPNGQYVAAFAMWGNTHDLALAYIKKTRKLNADHFSVLGENNLFITSWMIDEAELSDGIQKILSYSANDTLADYPYHFDHIYICRENLLVTIAHKSQQVNAIQIPSTVMSEISETAFTEIFGMTREQYYSR